MYGPKKIVQTVKSIIAREIFGSVPMVKKALWGGQFWTKGSFILAVGQFGNEKSIAAHIEKQGRKKAYKKLHSRTLRFDLILRSLLRGSSFSLPKKLLFFPISPSRI
jgi:putative transposase